MSEIKTLSSLKSILAPSKTVEAEYPGMPGFKLNLSFLSREDLVKIRKKSTVTEYKKGALVEKVNDELFLELYTKGCIKGWTGLKLSYLEKLVAIDVAGQNPEDTLAFSEEDAVLLMKQSTSFDGWISDTVTELSNFPSNSGKK